MSTRLPLSRRTFLGGAAAAIGLPMLDAMRPATGYALGEGAAPTRLFFFYVPNGIHMPGWTPVDTGAEFTPSPILTPLAELRSEISVISGLANRNAIDSVPGDHARGTGAFLTAKLPRRTEGSDIELGISCDQVAASALAAATRIPSLQLGLEAGRSSGNCDSGYSCAYARNISWSGPATPLPKMISPAVVYDRLFAGLDANATREERERRRAHRTSVLDYAIDDTERLGAQLGATDRARLDQYLTALRELELRILTFEGETSVCTAPDEPAGYESDVETYCDLMLELAVVAMRCDITRVVSFMLANAATGRSYDFLGVSGAHHELSHHQNRAENLAALQTINTWEVERFARLLERMRETEDGDATLLDRSAVYFSSEIADGDSHSHINLPVVVAGRANGAIAPQGHLRLASEQPMARLFVSMIQAVDPTVSTFGTDGDAPLAEIAAT